MNRRTRTVRTACAAAVCAALALTGCGGDSGGKDFRFSSATKLGKLMPAADRKAAYDFGGTLLSGHKVKLSDTAGQVRVINFWASWCPPCKVETPQLDVLYREVRNDGVTFLGIDTKDDKDNAKTFVANNDISFPMLFDQRGETALRLGNIPANLPFTVLVDKAGKVAAVYVGGLTPKDLRGPIDTLLTEK